MRQRRKASTLLATAVILAGCYNARVNTGLPPSDQVIEEKWAASWIGGAVSPETVETASECPNGVAQVHTYHSFLNMLVAGLTAGIFTPMTIRVTCASAKVSQGETGAADIIVDTAAPMEEQMEQLQEAVDRSNQLQDGVVVRF